MCNGLSGAEQGPVLGLPTRIRVKISEFYINTGMDKVEVI